MLIIYITLIHGCSHIYESFIYFNRIYFYKLFQRKTGQSIKKVLLFEMFFFGNCLKITFNKMIYQVTLLP